MLTSTNLSTVPGVTAEQIDRAMDVVRRVYAEMGVPVRLEAQAYKDPELSGPPVAEIAAYVDPSISNETMLVLIRAVPAALRRVKLYSPEVPIVSHPFREW